MCTLNIIEEKQHRKKTQVPKLKIKNQEGGWSGNLNNKGNTVLFRKSRRKSVCQFFVFFFLFFKPGN